MEQAHQILQRARNLIEAGWIQGGFAKDAKGNRVACTSPDAVCFCAVGALLRAAHEIAPSDHDVYLKAKQQIMNRITTIGEMNITTWNDHTSRDDVLRVFNQACGEFENAA
jgi:hypothetical protein